MYLHVPIYLLHQRWLQFAVKEKHFLFVAMPFGLPSAPRMFTKVLALLLAHLRTQGTQMTSNLNNLLLKDSSPLQFLASVQKTIQLLQAFGWMIRILGSNPGYILIKVFLP